MGETCYTDTKWISKRIEWSEVLDALGKPKKLGQKGMLEDKEKVFASEQFQS